MATVTNYPIDLPILVIEAQIFVAVNKFQYLPNKLIPIGDLESASFLNPKVPGSRLLSIKKCTVEQLQDAGVPFLEN